PSHGALSGVAPNLTYTPDSNYHGPDSFTFTTSDGTNTSDPATVSITVNAPQTTVTLNPNKDSFVRDGAKNINEGANPLLMLQQAGHKRTLVSFDLSPYSGNHISSAKLRLFIAFEGNNWGKNGRAIEVHQLSSSWVEGNGLAFIPKQNTDDDTEEQKTKGSGSGVTWNCAIDTAIQNHKADCNPLWKGGTFVATATDTKIIKNGMLGQWVEFDVTSDVNSFLNDAPNNGWIITKAAESAEGKVGFASKENSDTSHMPQLVLNFS
ncbi:MAG: DNRLRE domain-containing protein, partial [Thaumarchaeota archaeon]|nr:DNRLRE domain-containing protein [Nitrososphaerota archaeon]